MLGRFVAETREQARAFEPHYMERNRANGRTISDPKVPAAAKVGWVTVYNRYSPRTKQQ